MKKIFGEFTLFFEGMFVFAFLAGALSDFLAAPSLLTFPELFFGATVYVLYRITVNLVTANLEKVAKAKKDKAKLARKLAKARAKKGP